MLSRRHERVLTATTTDVFSATDLRQAPGPGAVGIWAACDQIDATISVRVGAQVYANATLVPQRTTSIIAENEQLPIALAPVRGGELINVDVVEVTAATAIRVLAVWMGR